MDARDFYGDEKGAVTSIEEDTQSQTPSNSRYGRKGGPGVGFVNNLLSHHRKPKAPKATKASRGGASTNGSMSSRWGGGKIANSFKSLTTKAPSPKPEKPVKTNDEGQSAQSSKWWSRPLSKSFSRNKPEGEGKSWFQKPKWVTNISERRASKKETAPEEKEKAKETEYGGTSPSSTSPWYKPWSWSPSKKGEEKREANTDTGSKFSLAKSWASVWDRTANKPAKPEKTGSEAEATDAPKAAWWSLSRYTGASKRDAANGEKEDNPKSESFFKRRFGRKNRDESKSGSWTGTDDSSVPSVAPSEVSRTDAGSRGRWFDLRSRLAKNKAGEKSGPEVIIIVDPEDPENTVTPGGGRAAGKKSAESTNVAEEEPAQT